MKQHNIEITARMRLAVDSLKSDIAKMSSEIDNGLKAIGAPANLTKSFETQFSGISKSLSQMTERVHKGFQSASDFGSFSSNLTALESKLEGFQQRFQQLKLDPAQLLPDDAKVRIDGLTQALAKARNTIQNLNSPATLNALRTQISDSATKVMELEAAYKDALKAATELNQKKNEKNNAYVQAKEDVKIYKDLLKDVEAEQAKIAGEKTDLGKKWKNYRAEVVKANAEIQKLEAQQKGLSKEDKKGQAGQQITQQIEQLKAQREALEKAADQGGYRTKEQIDGYKKGRIAELANEQRQLNAEIKNGEAAQSRANKEVDAYNAKLSQQKQIVRDSKAALDQQRDSLKQLRENLANIGLKGSSQAIANLKKEFEQLGVSADELKKLRTLEDFNNILTNLKTQELSKVAPILQNMGLQLQEFGGKLKVVKRDIEAGTVAQQKFDQQMSEVNALKSRIQYFFGLTNSIQLLRRTIRSAFNTIKELDAQMVETAVVTDFSVSDMWEKLPTYTKQASALGAEVIDLYGATTLYYQQGLKTNEAIALGTETMKMARIAGMESAEATEAMTAALRGFNMELNETSATRVNDVYSELAAITAADTEQIATAMTKTASIASSANMEFETTAALLAQIIETTQEAPETAGTAMKTIIARFTEVKELFSQGQLTGEDSEGEEISINKIDAALKTVGISLKDFLNGTKGIDDIFLELASKWDSLDLATQRYIATMAAGSRQQSRFIAMMSDYERTMELVNAANNSTGASQRQFEKTTEGLQASLNELKNAWNEFLMGLANESVIKDVIDTLTTLLNLINDLTSLWGHAGGSETLLLRLGITAAGFKVAKVAIAKGLNSFASTFAGAGASNGLSFWQAFVSKKSLRAARNGLIAQKGAFQDFKGLWGVNGKGFVADTQAIQGMTFGTKEYGEEILRLKTKYQLTDNQAQSFSQTLQNNGQVSDWAKQQYNEQTNAMRGSIQGYREQEAAIKKAQTAQIRSIATMVGITIAIYAIIKAAEIAKKTLDETITTSQEKIEGLEKVEEGLVKETEKLQDTLKNFSDIRTGFDDMIDQVKDLRRGTAEWASTMHSARTQIYDILQTYPDLSKYVEEINGIQTLSEAGWIEYEKQLINDLYKTEILLAQNQAQQQSVKDVQAAENLKLPTSTISAKEAAAIEKGTTTGTYIGGATGAVGGWIAGTAAGAAIGAKGGSAVGTAIAPGLGTIMGALAGVLLGALIGHIAGGGMSATEGVSVDAINNVALEAARDEKFSAETATREEIEQFVENLGHTGEELNVLTDYIEKNRNEFDAYSQAMAQSQDQMISYGKQIGSILADEKGYTGKDRAYFESIGGFIYGEFYDKEKEYQKTLLTGDAQDYIELAAQSGKFKYNAELGTIKDLEGDIIELTDEQIIDIAAGVKAAEALTARLEEAYNFAKGNDALEWQSFMADSSSIGDYSIEYLLGGLQEDLNKVKTQYSSFLRENSDRTYQDWGDFFRLQGKDVGFTLEGEYNYNRGLSQNDNYAYSGNKEFSFTPEPSQTAGADTKELLELYIEESGIPTTYSGGKLEFFNGVWKYSENLIQERIIEYAAEQGIILSQQLVNEMLKGPIGEEALSQLFREEELRNYFTIDGVDYSAQLAEDGNLEFLKEFRAGMVKSYLESVHALSDIDYELDVDEHFLNPLKKVYEALETPDEKGQAAGEAVKKQVLNGLMSLDSQDIRDAGFLKSLKTSLTQLAGTSEETDAAINEYVDGLLETGVAISKIDIETLTKQLEATFGVLDKIEGLEANDELKLTKEELDALMNSVLDFDTSEIRKDFFATGDGFVYLGENIETLKDIIIDANEQLLGIQTVAIQKKVDQGKFINDELMTGKYLRDSMTGDNTTGAADLVNKLDWDTVETWTATDMSNATYAIIETIAGREGMTGEQLLDSPELRALLNNTPLERLGLDVIEDLYTSYGDPDAAADVFAQLSGGETAARQYFIDAADAAKNQTTNEKMVETGMSELRQEALSHYSIDQLTNMDPSKIIGKEEYDKTVTYNEETGRYENPEGNEVFMQEDIDLAIKNRLAERDLTSFKDQLVDQGVEDNAAARIAEDNADLNEGLGEVIGTYDEWTGLIDKSTGLIKANTSEDIAAFDKLKGSVNKMLNTSTKLSDAFWNNAENMKNLKKAAEGDTEALEALQKAAASDYLTNIDFGLQADEEVAKGAVQDFVDYMNEVDIPKLEAGVEWNDDEAQQFIDSFNAMARASNMTAEQIQESVQAMGFDAKIKMVEQKRMVPVYSTTSWTESGGTDENGNPITITHSGAPVIEKYEEVEGFFPVVETLTASGAGGGGVSIENVDGGKANAKKGKGGGSEKKDWKNPYDKHYNTLQEINEALRERERLERRYQRLLEQSDVKGGELVKNAEQQIEKAENEIALNKKLNSQRAQQIQEEIDEKGLGKYYSVIENEYGEYEIRIDWEAINAVKDEEEGQKIEDSLGDVERWSNDINEGNDTIEDIRDNTQEIRKQGEDEYFDLETRIKDALVQAQQDEIDKLSEINTSINDTNARLIETMQYNLEQERQMRENDKTEQELEDKQRRLEYLSQDTSGANALEIKQLQKEIDEGRESYTDTLIDQKISELQHQNDEAAEQRQRQIDIAQSQLDHYVKTGKVWNDVYSLMGKGIGENGIKPGSELETLLKDNDKWAGKSVMEKLKWGNDLSRDVALAIQYLKVGNSTESLIESKELKAGESVTFTTSDNTTLSGKVMENGDVVADGKTYTGIYRTYDGNWLTDEAYQGKNTEPPQSETPSQTETPPQTEEKKEIKVGGKINAKGAKIYKSYDDNNGRNQLFGDDPIYNVLEEKNGRVRVRHHSQDSGTTGWFKKSAVKAYKTGGLADYTGPAWLDGTKSKPELVLNAQDTQNFIQLKNVLASLMSGTGKSSENIGDNTYDIDINVESIGSDYDVEQMAEKIKSLINQDARYRNNNTVSLMR